MEPSVTYFRSAKQFKMSNRTASLAWISTTSHPLSWSDRSKPKRTLGPRPDHQNVPCSPGERPPPRLRSMLVLIPSASSPTFPAPPDNNNSSKMVRLFGVYLFHLHVKKPLRRLGRKLVCAPLVEYEEYEFQGARVQNGSRRTKLHLDIFQGARVQEGSRSTRVTLDISVPIPLCAPLMVSSAYWDEPWMRTQSLLSSTNTLRLVTAITGTTTTTSLAINRSHTRLAQYRDHHAGTQQSIQPTSPLSLSQRNQTVCASWCVLQQGRRYSTACL